MLRIQSFSLLLDKGQRGGERALVCPISCPIKPPLKLQPSFCNDYVVSSYTIIAKVSIGGVYARLAYLLQVAYPCSARRNPEHAGAESQGLAPSPLPQSPEYKACCFPVDTDLPRNNVRRLLPCPLYLPAVIADRKRKIYPLLSIFLANT